MQYRYLLSALLLSLNMNIAQAAVFNVQENPNNALDTFPNNPGESFIVPGETDPPNSLTADIGRNITLGGLGNCFGFGCSDDYDSFRIVVPAGIQITAVEFTVPNLDGTAEQLWVFPGLAGDAIRQVKDNVDWRAGALFALTDNISSGSDSGVGPVTNNTILGPGTYDVVAFNFNFISPGEWRADFIAAPVPLLASIWFIIGGLIAIRRFAQGA